MLQQEKENKKKSVKNMTITTLATLRSPGWWGKRCVRSAEEGDRCPPRAQHNLPRWPTFRLFLFAAFPGSQKG